MGKSNELGQFATLVTVDSASDNVFFGPSILPTVSIDTNAGIITSTALSAADYQGNFILDMYLFS